MERWGFMFPGAPWVQKLLPPQATAEEKLYRKREAEGRRDGAARGGGGGTAIFLQVWITKEFKFNDFVSVDSTGVARRFFGSVDWKGVSGESWPGVNS
jgi:hypothetical protein